MQTLKAGVLYFAVVFGAGSYAAGAFEALEYGWDRPRPDARRGVYACLLGSRPSSREYLATRDPVAGTVYYVMLGLFAVMRF